jgi:hypothetical protein
MSWIPLMTFSSSHLVEEDNGDGADELPDMDRAEEEGLCFAFDGWNKLLL